MFKKLGTVGAFLGLAALVGGLAVLPAHAQVRAARDVMTLQAADVPAGYTERTLPLRMRDAQGSVNMFVDGTRTDAPWFIQSAVILDTQFLASPGRHRGLRQRLQPELRGEQQTDLQWVAGDRAGSRWRARADVQLQLPGERGRRYRWFGSGGGRWRHGRVRARWPPRAPRGSHGGRQRRGQRATVRGHRGRSHDGERDGPSRVDSPVWTCDGRRSTSRRRGPACTSVSLGSSQSRSDITRPEPPGDS